MNTATPSSGGWLESLRRIGESLSALLRSRFEPFAVEWQEAKLRLRSLFCWLVLAATVGAAGVSVAIFTLAFWLWATTGYAGLMGLVVAALAVASGIGWAIRRKIQTGPTPFVQTVAEFRKDSACLRTNN